jgi:hypothetical protein
MSTLIRIWLPDSTIRRSWSRAAGACTEHEFFARLRQAGVLVRLRHSTVSPGQVTGYAVGLARQTARDGGVIWYGGGKLAADLTLPKLRARWHPPAEHDPLSDAELPAAAVRAVLRNKVTMARSRRGTKRGSSPGCGIPGSWCGCGSARRAQARSPGTQSRSPATGPDKTLRWYGGGRLAAGLTLPPRVRHFGRLAAFITQRSRVRFRPRYCKGGRSVGISRACV